MKKKSYKKKSYKKKSYKKKSIKKYTTKSSYKKQKELQHTVGDIVTIIIKPYHKNITVKGKIQKILTKRKYHSRGHKVELVSGIIGRIV